MSKTENFTKIESDLKKDMHLVRLRSGKKEALKATSSEQPQQWLHKVQELLLSQAAQ